MIKLVITDDELLIREGLEIILGQYDDIDVLALCKNGEEAYEFCKNNDVDLVLMDIRMPDYDGIYGTKKICGELSTKVLILTTFQDTEYIQEAMAYGASGYLLKDSSYDVLVSGIRSAAVGNTVFHSDVASKLLQSQEKESAFEPRVYDLSEREMELIAYVAEGKSNQEIADALFLSQGTVKNAISMILQKTQTRDRTQLAVFAYKNHIV